MNTDIISRLKTRVRESHLNENSFFLAFQQEPLEKALLSDTFQQYYYYIRTFPQILAGLSHRVESEKVRFQLARTVVSELGGGEGPAHFQMFEEVMDAAGAPLGDYKCSQHIPEAEALVSGLREIFLEGPTNVAVGGHYAIEETGLPMIKALYEGFRHYQGETTESMAYFYLHLFLEAAHVDWIADAVLAAATDAQSEKELEEGTVRVVALLSQFWLGLHEFAYGVAPSRSYSGDGFARHT